METDRDTETEAGSGFSWAKAYAALQLCLGISVIVSVAMSEHPAFLAIFGGLLAGVGMEKLFGDGKARLDA